VCIFSQYHKTKGKQEMTKKQVTLSVEKNLLGEYTKYAHENGISVNLQILIFANKALQRERKLENVEA
tara:strand:- start:1 stop:204 length:204 start_codon:yes stop_codon:yes gene_type:complete